MAPRWKVLFAFTGVFVAGVIAGGVASFRAAITKTTADQTAKVTIVPTDQFGPDQLKRFTRQLSLTPEQSEKIHPIIDKAGENLGKIRSEVMKQTSAIIDAMQDEVAKQLTDEQRVKLAAIKKQQHERYNNFNNRGGPNRRGGPGGPDNRPALDSTGKPLPNQDSNWSDPQRGPSNGNGRPPGQRPPRSSQGGRPPGFPGNTTEGNAERHPEPTAPATPAPAPTSP